MSILKKDIQIISAPSILGLKPSGVEHLGESLISAHLTDNLHSKNPLINIPTQNLFYSFERDRKTECLNPTHIREFSITLIEHISQQIDKSKFPLVLGGDCSILLGIMPALKSKGTYGLIFLDAHADFYAPSQSITGEVADMDLAIITGRGPEILTNINNLIPYVKEENVIHIGQRDAEETIKYHSQDIQDTSIKLFDLKTIHTNGLNKVMKEILQYIDSLEIEGFWIHFDTDVLSDDENPAVDYRIPGGLLFEEAEFFMKKLLATEKSIGMSVTIFNPNLDTKGTIAKSISNCISQAFN